MKSKKTEPEQPENGAAQIPTEAPCSTPRIWKVTRHIKEVSEVTAHTRREALWKLGDIGFNPATVAIISETCVEKKA